MALSQMAENSPAKPPRTILKQGAAVARRLSAKGAIVHAKIRTEPHMIYSGFTFPR